MACGWPTRLDIKSGTFLGDHAEVTVKVRKLKDSLIDGALSHFHCLDTHMIIWWKSGNCFFSTKYTSKGKSLGTSPSS